jgi:hypothetical protein
MARGLARPWLKSSAGRVCRIAVSTEIVSHSDRYDLVAQLPADPWQSPTDGLELRRPGQGAVERADAIRAATPAWKRVGALLLNVHTEEAAWRKGAQGEHRMARQLRKLDRYRWLVLHDVTVPGSKANIDHLLIGPPGVFTVNTKNHAGKRVWVYEQRIGVGNRKTDYLRNARWEASKVRTALEGTVDDLYVAPVVAIYAENLDVKSEPPDVLVRNALSLRRWLERIPGRYDPEEVRVLQMRAAEVFATAA